jgi:hypothetical protein
MSRKSEYAAHADECRRLADAAVGGLHLSLMRTEEEWRRMARGCFETAFGRTSQGPGAAIYPFVR